MADLLARSNSFQRAADHLACAGAVGVFRQAVLEQFGVGQNDPELIVQEMKELGQFTVRHSDLRDLRVFRVYARHDRFRPTCAGSEQLLVIRAQRRAGHWRRAKVCQ